MKEEVSSDESQRWWVLVLLGVALNQTQVISGLNVSVADPIVILVLMALGIQRKLVLPRWALCFFVSVSVVGLGMAFMGSPMMFGIVVPYVGIFVSLAKLAVIFLYFVLGWNLARLNLLVPVLRFFVIGAVVVGVVAMLSLVLPGLAASDVLFYGGFRFRGLMNDPNYFAVIQLAALSLVIRDDGLRVHAKALLALVLVVSTLLSGSKTGAVVLVVWGAWLLLGKLVEGTRPATVLPRLAMGGAVLFSAALILVMTLDPESSSSLALWLEQFPALDRLAPLFLDAGSAVQQDGSSREGAWESALSIIAASPVLGIGIGTYIEVARALTGNAVLAHNTFLQLAAEWGIVLTATFLVWCLLVMFRASVVKRQRSLSGALRDALIVMFVGSVGISLNNARLFWIVLGMLAALVMSEAASSRRGSSKRQGADAIA